MPSDKAAVSRIIEKMAALPLGETRIMEVCGTHTMAIAKSGIRSMLPGEHPPALRPRMSRVRHSCRRHRRGAGACDAAERHNNKLRRHAAHSQQRSGDSLQRRRALGARVEIVYSPIDAIDIAEPEPRKRGRVPRRRL